ncbi:MAG: VWA domain-containing protein [Coriobacteriales bacterium]|nr:VWA domain-containing protein [Coriobacteriales bacterium]
MNRILSRSVLVGLALVAALITCFIAFAPEPAAAGSLETKTITYGDDYKSNDPTFTAGKAQVNWGGALFEGDPTAYNKDLAMLGAALCAASGENNTGYGQYIVDAYLDLGFSPDSITLYSYPYNDKARASKGDGSYNDDSFEWSRDEDFAFSIASTQLEINGQQRTVVVITCRGTQTTREGKDAAGFGAMDPVAKRKVQGFDSYDGYNEYVSNILDGLDSYERAHGIDSGSALYFVCGYSLGGAAANLAAGVLIDQGRDVWAYTFGALNSLNPDSKDKGNSTYNRIWNVFNYYDTYGPHGKGIHLGDYSAYHPAHGGDAWDEKLGQMKIIPFDYTGFFTSGDHEYDNHTQAGYYYAVANDMLEENDFETASAARDIVLVLDDSGSMQGEPIDELKAAAARFGTTALVGDTSICVLPFNGKPETPSLFVTNQNTIELHAKKLNANGGTDIGAALQKADELLSSHNGRKKIIVLMTDGHPENGMTDEQIITLADNLKSKGYRIYTLGFFSKMKDADKERGQRLLASVASEACHFEVDDAESLQYFFADIADMANGVRFSYSRIACPVDVTVECNGEVLSSVNTTKAVRTSFGSLTFELPADGEGGDGGDLVKVLRLREGPEYEITISGTGSGTMDYTIGYVDDEGEYTDMRHFSDIEIGPMTQIVTQAGTADAPTRMAVDFDGDGVADKRYVASANEYAQLVDNSAAAWQALIWLGVALGGLEVLHVLSKVLRYRKQKRRLPQ